MTYDEFEAWSGEHVCPIHNTEHCDCSPSAKTKPNGGTGQPLHNPEMATGLDPQFLADGVDVCAEGQRIAEQGIRYTIEGLIPGYGMIGMLVAFAKVGKTTLGQALAEAVAMGRPFLDRVTQRARVLVIAAEDPPEYTAYLARTLDLDRDWLTFYRAPVLLNAIGLAQIQHTIREGGYGFVLIASWQAVIRGLMDHENNNVSGVDIVERVKLVTRDTKIPWLIDAHSGKGEDQDDDADPTRALRGASGAAGSADYALSLRYANGTFGTQRRLSGKGRFVNLAPVTLDYDLATGRYSCLGSTKDATTETTWRLLCETGALTTDPRSITDIARRSGVIDATERLGSTQRRQIAAALAKRPTVGRIEEVIRGQKTLLYRLLEGDE
jgi:AAA domain